MVVSCNWDIVFPSNHIPIRGVLYWATPSFCTMMNVCNNGSFNGFWVKCNVMRPGLVAPAGLELSLDKRVRPMGRMVKLGFKAQGPNGPGVPCRIVLISNGLVAYHP